MFALLDVAEMGVKLGGSYERKKAGAQHRGQAKLLAEWLHTLDTMSCCARAWTRARGV